MTQHGPSARNECRFTHGPALQNTRIDNLTEWSKLLIEHLKDWGKLLLAGIVLL